MEATIRAMPRERLLTVWRCLWVTTLGKPAEDMAAFSDDQLRDLLIQACDAVVASGAAERAALAAEATPDE